MILEDEYGVQWEVQSGDPASKLVNTLKRNLFTWVVLARSTYLTGEVPLTAQGELPEELPECKDGTYPQLVLRARLGDCLECLKK